jgi:hydroxymethylpyrimidine pyrophosphatase-like HAD family hydrolase
MFVGDGGNDLAAMRVVGTAVAMANAEPEILAMADHVVDHVDAGGAVQALRMATDRAPSVVRSSSG